MDFEPTLFHRRNLVTLMSIFESIMAELIPMWKFRSTFSDALGLVQGSSLASK